MIRKEKIKEIWNQISYEIRNIFLKYQIFAILTGLFILAVPTWTMMESMQEENLWY